MELKKRTPGERQAYRDGMRAALRMFAWHKDGATRLYTTPGKTFAYCMAMIDTMEEAGPRPGNGPETPPASRPARRRRTR